MIEDQFRTSAFQAGLKEFLDTQTGMALISALRFRSRPSKEGKKAFGDAEDVKLQMALNFAVFEDRFDTIEFIERLAMPLMQKQVSTLPKGQLIPEDATDAELKAMGIERPPLKQFSDSESQP